MRPELRRFLERFGAAPRRQPAAADADRYLYQDCLGLAVDLSDKLARLHESVPADSPNKELVRNSLYRTYKVIALLCDLGEEQPSDPPPG
jgi:hypothetical protein